jgi:RimJ/RimL family protein N-acetyltransferase
MLTIEAAQKEDFALYESHTGYIVDPAQFRAIKAVSDGIIQGIVGFDYWTPTAVQLHIWATPLGLRGGKLITEAFDYAFNQAGKKVAFGIIPSSNERALRFVRKVGFSEVCRLRDGWDEGVDMVINEMRADNCRWLNKGHK